ncbi:UNVERIFIED_ORG: hypothetical protein FNL38_102295 [Nocardia globerula]|uniref:Uncharacterized protein n=1 Tax=Nocardia globerula TaxID=1818 RepID=A0A652YSV8_NOCGL|nr:hypothetical protein C8E04_4482 [Rhodococcus globerulus]
MQWRSHPALPHICRLSIFDPVDGPSTESELQGKVSPPRTVPRSVSNPHSKRCKCGRLSGKAANNPRRRIGHLSTPASRSSTCSIVHQHIWRQMSTKDTTCTAVTSRRGRLARTCPRLIWLWSVKLSGASQHPRRNSPHFKALSVYTLSPRRSTGATRPAPALLEPHPDGPHAPSILDRCFSPEKPSKLFSPPATAAANFAGHSCSNVIKSTRSGANQLT